MAELPVMTAAENLVTAMRELPTRAAQIIFFEAKDMLNPLGTVVMLPVLAIFGDSCLNGRH
jgi:hypothetical protein